jgi:phosphoglycolate phosphatase-like HAD superfamily hydrolase
MRLLRAFLPAAAIGLLSFASMLQAQSLASWRDGDSKKAIVDFVERVARRNSPDYVEPAKRIAIFDNDGTLWAEQPINFQLAFAIDSVKALAPQHPEWHNEQPFKSILTGDLKALEASGEVGLLNLLAISHAGMTTDEYASSARSWLNNARHPRYNRKYSALVYQPMIELLAYLRGNNFRTFIVSGGGAEFMRVFAEQAYGILPEQVIGSTGVTHFNLDASGRPVLIKEAKVEFVNDGPGKPSSINRSIGRRPIFAIGNSDGDLEMLQWTAGGEGTRFVGLIHHTDEKREYAYDRDSKIGRLDKALTQARTSRWTVVDMTKDWREVFPTSSSENH